MKELGDDDILVRSATNADCERVQELVFGVLSEYGLMPDPDGTDRDITDIERHFLRCGGCFEIIEDRVGNLLGTVGLHPLDAETVELRKMYFSRTLRGKGFGKKTLRRMIGVSKELGFKKIYLETASPLVEAIGLYKSFGFRPIDKFYTPRCDRAFVLEI